MKTHYFKEYLVLIKITHNARLPKSLDLLQVVHVSHADIFSEQISYPCENREWLPVLHDPGAQTLHPL